ncbi:hypothetical protein K32_37830 [Kaistia sp. 32K]|uniref:hypothetical protein n=1 Tax=Kaistia sp. 32K TaxID=2795690 RepID=UPI001915F200|nr:hypothetical protein [Kaistia sp. 32K]BCP55166.1 hypothetical protein K32_37830 [Kaistia sp. 32K]
MTFVADYFVFIDVLALLALAGLAIATFARNERVWSGILLLVVLVWVGARLFKLV